MKQFQLQFYGLDRSCQLIHYLIQKIQKKMLHTISLFHILFHRIEEKKLNLNLHDKRLSVSYPGCIYFQGEAYFSILEYFQSVLNTHRD